MSEQDPKAKTPTPAAPAVPKPAPPVPKPAPPTAAKVTSPPPAPKPAAPPVPKTAAGRAALERHRANAADWDAIAAAAINASGLAKLAVELDALRARHRQLTEAGHQVCDSISPLFAALARGES